MSKVICEGLTLILSVLMLACIGVAEEEKPLLFVGKSPTEVYQQVHQARWKVDADTVLA